MGPNLADVGVLISIDAGTTGVRAMAVDLRGMPIAHASTEFPQHFPRPGWVEHDATDIWNAVLAVLGQVIAQIDEPVAGIGITDQRETVVAWSATTGRPLHRAIVWQDRRTADRCAALADAGHLPLVRSATGLVLDPYFSATKFEWLLGPGMVDTGPDLLLGTVDSWIAWNLTGGRAHVTDPSNASRTMLFDLRTGWWSDELLDLFGVPRRCLPEIVPTAGRLGVTTSGLPLPAGIPVSALVGDQQSSLFGQACFDPGMAKNTYGTGSFVLANVGVELPEPVDGLLTTVAWKLGDERPVYALEGAVFVTGAAIQWLRDGLGIIADAAEIGPLAASVPDSGGVVFVPAFTGLGSPWWDPYARGTIFGLTRGSGRPELARAVVDAMVLQTRDVVDAMTAASGVPLAELRVDGGASVMDLLLQLQADHLGVPVTRARFSETTALGAAYLAGLAEGVWSSTRELAELWSGDSTFHPAGDRAATDRDHARWHRAVERSRHWATLTGTEPEGGAPQA